MVLVVNSGAVVILRSKSYAGLDFAFTFVVVFVHRDKKRGLSRFRTTSQD